MSICTFSEKCAEMLFFLNLYQITPESKDFDCFQAFFAKKGTFDAKSQRFLFFCGKIIRIR
ncbi:MAG TPA: hypothetical protein DCG49_03050 [Ruminococcus sp.]|nr:hypothetical protein [Ruminococcus sp.]